jgi:hypothetical protein
VEMAGTSTDWQRLQHIDQHFLINPIPNVLDAAL